MKFQWGTYLSMVSFHPSASGASNTSRTLRSRVRQLRKMDATRQPSRGRDQRVIDTSTVIGDEQGITTPISAVLKASNTTIQHPAPHPKRIVCPG